MGLGLDGILPPGLNRLMATPRYALNKTKYLLPPEVDRLTSIIKSYLNGEPRDVLMLWLALKSGARATELLNIKKVDLNEYDQSVFVRGIKGSNDREVPLPQELFNGLKRYAASIEGERLFGISYERLHQIWHLYRPVPKKFHSLRHTFAIHIYQKTKDLRLVQTALGHRNIMNTMIYADYVYTQEEMRKIL